jgi:Flp pilus assembly protein TadD
MKPHVRHASALCAIAALVPLLAGCASDPLVDSLRPSPADRAEKPEPPPAGTVAELVRLGDAMREKGDPQGAVAFYRRAHARDHFNPAPLVGLGEALDDLGAYNDAAAAFRQALVGQPANADALRGLGNALLALNQPALAIDQFEAALRARPDARCHNGIGVARDRLGDHKGAEAAYRAGLALAPDDPALLNNLGLSLALAGDTDGAIATLEKVVRSPTASARQRQNLALVYGLAGRNGDAARMARVDLGDDQIAANVAAYGRLRALRAQGAGTAPILDAIVSEGTTRE